MYRHFSTLRTNALALTACRNLGPGWDLASIHSEEENNFVFNLVSPPVIRWLGGVRDRSASVPMSFVNTDGTPFDFSAWNPGTSEPNDLGGVEDCVQMGHANYMNANWNDASCSFRRAYVCKRNWGMPCRGHVTDFR